MPKEARKSRKQSKKKDRCSICGKSWDLRALTAHEATCQKRQRRDQRFADRAERAADLDVQGTPKRKGRKRVNTMVDSTDAGPSSRLPRLPTDCAADGGPPSPVRGQLLWPDAHGSEASLPQGSVDSQPCGPDSADSAPPANGTASQTNVSEAPQANSEAHSGPPPPDLDDIRVEPHPQSGRATTTYAFDKYAQEQVEVDPASIDDRPWRPFASKADFELAELTHEAGMSARQVDRLLTLVRDILAGRSKMTYQNHADVNKAWEDAARFYPTFTKSEVSASFQGDEHTLEFHHRPLWDWIVSQVEEPKLAPYFKWDAEKLSKYNGREWVRFYEEPHTADMFWEAQTSIATNDDDPAARPLSIILWSDKTKLSSFGSQKGHPIIARIGNIHSSVRNGSGLGGGRVVGFIPVVKDDIQDKGKTDYVDFKTAIFHDSFRVLLEEVAKHSLTGWKLKCGDGIWRVLYPFIHILSADYEEQCYLALIRGLNSAKPCPICVVPSGPSLFDLSTSYPERSEADAHELLVRVESKTQKKKALKEQSLRPVANAFWGVANTNLYKALSLDGLHAHHGGLWGRILWVDMKNVISAAGRNAEVHFDKCMDAVPSWPDLTHFPSALQIDFSDGSKWDDLSKTVLQSSVGCIPRSNQKGYALLKVIRKYLEVNVYFSFRVHTEETLQQLEETLQDFSKRLQEYVLLCQNDAKPRSWGTTIKGHSHVHGPRDIRLKGAMNGMSTKPNEKLNGPLRTYYSRTNKKKIEGQMAKLEDRSMVVVSIRSSIDAWEEHRKQELDSGEESVKTSPYQFHHVRLGGIEPLITIAEIQARHQQNNAFKQMEAKIASSMLDLVRQQYATGELTGTAPASIKVAASDKITCFRNIRVNYESKVTWRQVTDLLRCTNSFFGAPRHDSVLVDTDQGPIFCKLALLFIYIFESRPYALALVEPFSYSTPIPSIRNIDRDLGLCRVSEMQPSRIISARAIRRGALLVSDPSCPKDHFVVDMLDGDMFLRAAELFPGRNMAVQKIS